MARCFRFSQLPDRRSGPMWVLLVLLWLPPRSSAVPLSMFQALAFTRNDSSHRLRTSSTSPPPLTASPPHSEAPALSLNLGLNFKIKLRSQGQGRLADAGPREASVRPRLPPTHSQALGNRFWPEALGGSGWMSTGPADELPSSPGRWGWDRSRAHAIPTPQHPGTLWPKLTERGLVVPTSEHDKELEFKIDIDLTAGLGQDGGLAPNSSVASRRYTLFPGLRVGISEIASRLGAPGLFGSTLPPEMQEPPLEQNVTGHSREHLGGSRPTPAQALQPGLESSSAAASGTGAAPPSCPLHYRPEDCGWAPPPAPALPLCLPPPADWTAALALWGPAWQAQLYGTATLSALQVLLALPALLRLPCHRRAPTARLLALLLLLLTTGGGARAALLWADAWGARPALLPPWAARLLRDLPLPCLTAALALALLLLPPPPPGTGPSPARPCGPPACPLMLLLPPLLHFSVAAGAALAAAPPPPQLPVLLLASRGTFALLAALLAAALLASAARSRGPKSATRRCWCGCCCGRTALPAAAAAAASCGLLNAGLHAYGLLQALGLGLPARLLGPWVWWALQLAGRLSEVGTGLPLAWLGLAATLRWTPPPPRTHTKGPPQPCPWDPEKPGSGAGEAARTPLAEELRLSPAALDPTAGFRPPSPVDLRRSIDEALGGGGGSLFAGGGDSSGCGLSSASTLSLGAAAQPWPEGESPIHASPSPAPRSAGPGPVTPPASPGPGRPCCRALPAAASQESLASAGPGGQAAAEAALLRREFLAVCRQIDALSVSSDTIEL